MNFIELLVEGQFHGAKRFADSKYRWFWTAVFLVLFTGALNVLFVTVIRYLEEPTFLVQIEANKAVLAFPSVKICPEINYPENKIDAFLNNINYPPELNVTFVQNKLRQLAAFYAPDVHFNVKDLESLENLLEYNKLDLEATTQKLTTSCEETLIREMMMRSKPSSNPYKWFTGSVGHTTGLMIAVNQSQTHYDIDLTYKWVALQDGQSYVDIRNNGTALSPGVEQWYGYSSYGFRVTSDTRELSSDIRGCRLTDEPLKYFPNYNKEYCLVECEMARMQKLCQCIALAHPRPAGIISCSARKLSCLKHATVALDAKFCGCSRGCDEEETIVTTQSYNLIPNSQYNDRFYDGLDFKKISIVRVYMKDYQQNMGLRQAYFSRYNLFAQLGGIFSLFFGCSVLTMLELVQLAWVGLRSTWKRC